MNNAVHRVTEKLHKPTKNHNTRTNNGQAFLLTRKIYGLLKCRHVFSVIWLDIVYIEELRQRVTACGHQSGIVTLTLLDLTTSGNIHTIEVNISVLKQIFCII